MKVYFARHGEGEHNVKKLYSDPGFKLTKRGEDQASFLAKRLKELSIELIIASSFKRTAQTAEIINKELKKEIILSDQAVEIKRPKEIAGKPQNNSEVIAVKEIIDKNFHLPNWHYSDEENFYDLKKRATNFIRYLEGFKQNNILVVSHVQFIKMAVFTIMLQENLTPEIFSKASDFFKLETSGLTVCEKSGNHWKLITWNDHAHLAEN